MTAGGCWTDDEHQSDERDDGDQYDGELHARAEVLWHRIESRCPKLMIKSFDSESGSRFIGFADDIGIRDVS